MKITRAGTFVWTPADGPVIAGWMIDMEGAPAPDERDTLACILNHIALTSGLRAAPPIDPLAAAAEAQDALDRARRAGM